VAEWQKTVAGRTILLTTHYMAEADELCDRIAIVDHGRILAIGTPDELRARVQRESIFRLELDRLDGGPAALSRLPGVVKATAAGTDQANGRDRQTVEVNLVLENDTALGGVVAALGGVGAEIRALRKSEPSLEDVFVELVGRGFEELADGEQVDGREVSRDRDYGAPGSAAESTESAEEARVESGDRAAAEEDRV
jgi:ABC-2 type transport system ATP-binding protein